MKKLIAKLLIAALVAPFAAGAAPGKAPPATPAAAPESWLEQLNAEAAAHPKKFAHLKRLRADVAAGGLSAQLKRELVNDQFFVADPAMTGYLTALVERLLAGWRGARPPVVILLKSHASQCAYSTADGEIVICTGMLRKLRTEEVLAALLSHELSHILLQHSAMSMLSNKLDMIVQGAGLMTAATQVYGDPSEAGASDALDTFAGTQAASLLWSDLLRTRNSREEEKKSDELGTDLTVAAGIGSSGWDLLFTILKQDAGALSARMVLLQEVAKARMLHDAGKSVAEGDDEAFKELAELGAMNEAQKQAFEWLAELNVDHPPTGVREKNRGDYERAVTAGKPEPPPWQSGDFAAVLRTGPGAELLDLDSKALALEEAIESRDPKKAAELFALLTKNPESMQPRTLFAAAQYSHAQKDFAAADGFLARLIALPHSPASAYTLLASLRGKDLDKPAAAIEVLDAGVDKLQTKRPFLPLLAGMHAKSGNARMANKYWALCGCSSDKSGFSGDAIAHKLLGEQTDDLKQQCVKELGHDPDAKAQGSNAKSTWNPLDAAGNVVKKAVRGTQCLIDG